MNSRITGPGLILISTWAAALAPNACAQEPQLTALQASLDTVTGVLEEALDLNQSTTLFGLSVGGIESTYLMGQGVVFEIRSPLANRRGRMGLAALNSAMRSLSESRNPFEALQRRTRPAPEPDQDGAEGFYQDMMDRIARVDYSLMIDSAVQQASESLRSLRTLGNIEQSDFDALQEEISVLQGELDDRLTQLQALEQQIDTQAALGQAEASDRSPLHEQLESIVSSIEPLRDSILERAEELKQRSDIAEREYAERWQQDLLAFEASLYAAMCDYGASLRELPDGEYISLLLNNLGVDMDAGTRRTNKIHVLAKADVIECLDGGIDAVTLQSRSTAYSY